MGATDNIYKGQSTFMVELQVNLVILNLYFIPSFIHSSVLIAPSGASVRRLCITGTRKENPYRKLMALQVGG